MKTVLISGGSGGIGGASARAAAAAGWRVLIGYDQHKDRAELLQREIQQAKGEVDILALPLTNLGKLDAALESLRQTTASLTALVVAASPAPALASFTKVTAEQLTSQWSVNVVGAHRLLAACWKHFFSPAAEGHVVALLSAAMGPPPSGHMTSYVVAKRGLQALVECALQEFGRGGLRATALLPDYTETPMLNTFHSHVLDAARAKRPFLKPEDVARRVLYSLENPPLAGEFRHETVVSAETVQ